MKFSVISVFVFLVATGISKINAFEEENYLEEYSDIGGRVGQPYYRPIPTRRTREIKENEEEGLVQVETLDAAQDEDGILFRTRRGNKPYLPRPTARPVIPNYRPKREIEQEQELEQLVFEHRPHLHTPVPPYRPRREVEQELEQLVRTRRGYRPYLPRPTPRPIIPNYRPRREVEEEELEQLVRTRRGNRPYLPRPTPRPIIPNYRPRREVEEEELEQLDEVRVRRSNGRPYLPRPTQRPNY